MTEKEYQELLKKKNAEVQRKLARTKDKFERTKIWLDHERSLKHENSKARRRSSRGGRK
jgi:hypothetical protein